MYDEHGYAYWSEKAQEMKAESELCRSHGFQHLADACDNIAEDYLIEANRCKNGPDCEGVEPDTFKCDMCDAVTPRNERHVAMAPDGMGIPTEVMWMCPSCGEAGGFPHHSKAE